MKNGRGPAHLRSRESTAKAVDPDLIAIQALTFLGDDAERLERFFAVSGLSPVGLRRAAGDPGFLNGVLDYLMTDESLLVAFAAAQGLEPESLTRWHESRQM